MKYFGEKTKQDFIDLIYEGELTIIYKDATYDIWLDGNCYNIGMTYFKDKETTQEEMDKTIDYAYTVEELLDKYVMYDGVKMSDVLEMDTEEFNQVGTNNKKYDYSIYPDNSPEKFKLTCKKIEQAFPCAIKQKLLVDVDGSTIQVYKQDSKEIIVYDHYEIGAVFVLSDIPLEFL